MFIRDPLTGVLSFRSSLAPPLSESFESAHGRSPLDAPALSKSVEPAHGRSPLDALEQARGRSPLDALEQTLQSSLAAGLGAQSVFTLQSSPAARLSVTQSLSQDRGTSPPPGGRRALVLTNQVCHKEDVRRGIFHRQTWPGS